MLRRLIDRVLGRGPDEMTILPVGGDPAVSRATEEARATLDTFWQKVNAGAADEFQLKVGLTTPNEATEHVWLAPAGWRDGKVVGRLMNQPSDLTDVNLGDEILVDPERISDWAYFKGGQLWGAFTQRAMIHLLKGASRTQLEAVLSPTPLEPESK